MKYIEESIDCKGVNICSPFVHEANGEVHYVSTGTGEIYAIDGGMHSSVLNTNGAPRGAQFSPNKSIYVADLAHGCIFQADDENQLTEIVSVYEDCTFKGPSSVCFSKDGNIYFTDSGPLGESTIEKPTGSVFCIATSTDGAQILRPLALNCLAHPSAICVSPNEKYVAEMNMNRILRFVQKPAGVYHFSVFHQFSGGLGPSALACDSHGRLYVGSYDVVGGEHGYIYVLAENGDLETRLEVPGSEITGLSIRNDSCLYVTEASNNTLYSINLEVALDL